MHPHMEQTFRQHKPQQPNLALGWTQALVETTIAVPSESASSAIISPGVRDVTDSLSDSLGQGSTSLKEHDYIGLAEVSSAPPPPNGPSSEGELNLAETDLRLGLTPSSPDEESKGRVADEESKGRVAASSSHATNVVLHVQDDAKHSLWMPCLWQSLPSKGIVNAAAMSQDKGYQSLTQLAFSKNSNKRLYTEAMADAHKDCNVSVSSKPSVLVFNSNESKTAISPIISLNPLHSAESKPLSEGLFWAAPHVAACWQVQSEPRSSSFCAATSLKGVGFLSELGKDNGQSFCNPKHDVVMRGDGPKLQSFKYLESTHSDAPPAKGQVVGWPPVRAYRRSALATRSKVSAEDGVNQSHIYVKVNMDGIPVGRKVDLSAYKSYDTLLSALEDMFHNPSGGYGAKFLKGSEFVLTYEDKDGDWMLVGDVPWSMFVNTVRRLRITRGPESAGTGSRTSIHHA